MSVLLDRFLKLARLSSCVAAAGLGCVAYAQTAPPTTGLQLWLKADAGVTTNSAGGVSEWRDQSGNNNHALQTDETAQPKLVPGAVNSKPALRFDGASAEAGGDYLNVTSAPGLDIVGDIASFAVIRVDDYANYNSIWGKTAGAGGNIPAPNDWYLGSGSGIPTVFRGDGGGFQNIPGERAVRPNTYVVIGFRQVGTEFTHYLNGVVNGTGEMTVTPADSGTDLKIGTREDLFTKMKGDIAELLIYNEALTDAQTTTAINYLRNKYGIVNAAPTVSFANLADAATLSSPTNLTVTVNAADEDGSIARVALSVNGVSMGTATARPFSFPISIETGGTLVLSAVATDDRDATATNNITVTVTSTGPAPTLTPNSHLKLWLNAGQGLTTNSAGLVTAWADQSGSGNNAAQPDEIAAPIVGTLNGQPAVRFDGVDDFMDVADSDSLSITGDMASFAVVRFDDFAGFRAIYGKTSGNQPRPVDYYLASGTGIPNAIRGYTTNDTQNVNQGVAASGRVPTNTPVVLGFQQENTVLTHYRNGASFGSGRVTLVAQDMDTPLKIGSRDDFATRMKGEIAEILIFDAPLTTAQLENVRKYLGTKYNLASVQPFNAAPTVTLTGPSATTNIAVGGSLALAATAADNDGSVARIDFYANGSPVASDTSSPYTGSLNLNVAGAVAVYAVVTDNLGLRATSSIVNVTVTGGGTIPIPSSGLSLWLRSDRGITTNNSGAVTAWEDWSGNFNVARQTDVTKAPMLMANTLNHLPVLHFDGADDSLSVASSPSIAISGDITTYWVVNFEDYGTYRVVWAKTANNQPAANDYYLLPNSGIPRYYHGTPGAIAFFDGEQPVPTGEYVISGFALSGETATHLLGAGENGTGGALPRGGDTGASLIVGSRGDGVTKMKGTIAEIVIYNRFLDETERAQVVSYLQNKYALGGAEPQPELTVTRSGAGALVFSWPEAATGFVLESSSALSPANWTLVTDPVVPANGQNTVTVQTAGNARFFRLRK